MRDADPSTSADALALLWAHAEQHWDNEAAHDALLQQCGEPGQLAEVAKLYRKALEREGDDSERREVAERQLKRITALAMAQLEIQRQSRRQQEETRRPYGKYALIGLFLLASAILALNL